MTYLVAGVTGNTGKIAAETLLAQGKSVRVVVRDAAKGEAWRARGAEVAIADLSDAAALTRALDGVSGAYLLVPPLFSADFVAHQARITAALATAIAQSRVPHVVFLSSVGAQHAEGTGPIAGLHRAEAALTALPGTAFTFIRAAYFMENLGSTAGALATGALPSFIPKDFAFPMVATADIGRLAATELLEGSSGTHIIELGTEPQSMSDVAAVAATILGQSVTVQEAPVAIASQALAGMGFPAPLAALYQEMLTGIQTGHVTFEGGHRRVIARTSLETVLRGLLGR